MAPTANGNGHQQANTSDTVAGYRRRFEHCKYGDELKNALVEDVIMRYESLLSEHNDYVEQHQTERDLTKGILERERIQNGNIQHMQNILNRDPHLLVLVDGDSLIFHSTLLQQGTVGGQQAATLLHGAIIKWASAKVMDFPAESKIVVRVYANLKDLSARCYKAGFVDSPLRVEEFAEGFNYGNALFDFIDAGNAKVGKINETLKLYLYNYHCRHIVFGCGIDTASSFLRNYQADQEALARVTVLEGVPLDGELPFARVQFREIFRITKINVSRSDPPRVDSRGGLNAASDVFTPSTVTPTLHSPYSSTISLAVTGNGTPLTHARTESLSSSGNTSESNGNTWATVIGKNKHRPLTTLQRMTSEQPPETIKRNKNGQRVDMPLEYERDEVQRLKKLKPCNQHYIGIGCCHYNAHKEDKCPHNHHYNLSAQELRTMKVVARETPCKRGHSCDDTKCVYGHMCPFPKATEGSMRGIGCLNGELCRFPRSMHDMDTVAVKLVRAAGMF